MEQTSRTEVVSSHFSHNTMEEEDETRKLHSDVSRLTAENKQLKDRYNRLIGEKNELHATLDKVKQDISVQRTTAISQLAEKSRGLQIDVQKENAALVKENGDLKEQLVSLRQEVKSAQSANENAEQLGKLVEVYKEEAAVSKASIVKLSNLLEQSQLEDLQSRLSTAMTQVSQLTAVKDRLTQQVDLGTNGSTLDKQLKSLQKRLQVTEERLYQERADRANNLSDIEEKLITENARLQAAEKELTRQLQRHKTCVESQDMRIRELREENERLQLSMPIDILSVKSYDLPQSIHTTQRQENIKVDPDYVMSQIGRLEGLGYGQETDIIMCLWVKLEASLRQLQQFDLDFVDLRDDPDATLNETVKSLREMKREYEQQIHEATTKLYDVQSEKDTLDSVYKQSLGTLVEERQDAFARLKNMEDIIDAIHTENEMLRNYTNEPVQRDDSRLSGVDIQDHQAVMNENSDLKTRLTTTNQQLSYVEAQLSQLSIELQTRESQVSDLTRQLDTYKNNHDSDLVKQSHIMTIQIDTLTSELNKQKTINESMVTQKETLDERIALLQAEITSLKEETSKVGALETQRQHLTTELDAKETEITQLYSHCQSLESDVRHFKKKLATEQENRTHLETQLSSITVDITSRDTCLSALREHETQRMKHVEMMGVTITSLNAQLNQCKSTIKRLDVELSLSSDRVTELERKVSENSIEGVSDTSLQLAIREVERDRTKVKKQLIDMATTSETQTETLNQLQNDNTQLREASQGDKTNMALLTAENTDLQKQLHLLQEEKNYLADEKSYLEKKIPDLERRVVAVVEKKIQSTHTEQLGAGDTDLSVQPSKEAETLQTIVDGKDVEISILKEKIMCNKQELATLNRRVDYLNTSQQASRNHVKQALNDLNNSVKEKTSLVQLNQFLDKEKGKYQQESERHQSLVDDEKESVSRKNTDITEVVTKLEKSETNITILEGESLKLKDDLSESKATIYETEKMNSLLKSENEQLKASINQLDQDMRSLTSINSTLDSQLHSEKVALTSEKQQAIKQKDDLNTAGHQLESLKHEQTLWLAMIDNERKTNEKLKETLQHKDEQILKLKENLQQMTSEMESLRNDLELNERSLDQVRQDKQRLLQDLEEASCKLVESQSGTNEARDDYSKKVADIEREMSVERANLEKDRGCVEKELAIARQKIEDLNEKMRQKELQLSGFGKTLQELEASNKEKREQEVKLEKLERENQDVKILVSSHRAECVALRDQIDHIKGGHEKMSDSNEDLKEKMLIDRARSSQEVRDITSRMNALNVQHEHEKGQLTQQIHTLETKLETGQQVTQSLRSSVDEHVAKCRSLEQAMEEVKVRLQEESIHRKLAQEQVEMVKCQTDDRTREKTGLETKVHELQTTISKYELKLQSERIKVKQLRSTTVEYEQKLKSVTVSHQENVTLLQKEIKQQSSVQGVKFNTTLTEYKTKVEESRTEIHHLRSNVQLLTANLEMIKADNTEKNKENLRLQEEMFLVEDKLREVASKLKLVQDSLKIEQDLQAKLHSRNMEAEDEVKKLKTALNKFGGLAGGDAKWDGLSERVGELTYQLKSHLENKRDPDNEAVRWYTQRLKDTELELESERTMHDVTKKSLRDAEDDLRNLRQNLRSQKHRSPNIEDRSDKSRTERINEIIARSQVQAQAMLASGAHFNDVVTSSLNSSHILSPNVSQHAFLSSLNCSFTSTGTDIPTVICKQDSFDSS